MKPELRVVGERPTVAAIYARVSAKGQITRLQIRELEQYAERCGWTTVQYTDEGYSGWLRHRPALDRLMADARLRKFDVVLVWKLDRFGRSVHQLIENVRELDFLGIRFVAPSQAIDTDTRSPHGWFLINVFAAFAEFERDVQLDRVKAGIAAARAKGVHWGRPRKAFRIDKALEMRVSGMSWRRIARKLNVPESTIRLRLSQAKAVLANQEAS